ncbi:MAG: glycosyltransferase [Bacteroidetes bacterium]|nr:MAG: glycosyltransferase [Bacteroidota bacterium]
MQPKLSLVITVMNEAENIAPLLEQIRAALQGYAYEVVFVDDGSTDDTVAQIKAHADSHTLLVKLRKNYGQSTAMAAGIEQARGEYIVTLDGDLQNDPADIPRMLELAEAEDWDLVAGNRANRKDGFVLRKIPSKLANALIRRLTGVYIRDYGCTLKVFKSDIAKNLGLYGELHRFIPVLAKLQGATITQVDVKHHARRFGHSKYGISRTFRVISDLMLVLFFQKYLQKPMHIFGISGFLIFMLGMLINVYLVVLKLMGKDIWGKPLLILGLMLTIGGIQLITTGLITEVLMRTYYESQNKKAYHIREVFRGGEAVGASDGG